MFCAKAHERISATLSGAQNSLWRVGDVPFCPIIASIITSHPAMITYIVAGKVGDRPPGFYDHNIVLQNKTLGTRVVTAIEESRPTDAEHFVFEKRIVQPF